MFKSAVITSGEETADVDELMGTLPGGLIRNISFIFLFVFLITFFVSWFVKYPDRISGAGMLYAYNLPKPVVAKMDGKIAAMVAKDGDSVIENQAIVILKSIADYKEVIQLEQDCVTWWTAVNTGKVDRIKVPAEHYRRLGELETDFQEFYSSYIQLASFLSNGEYQERRALLQQDIENNTGKKAVLLHQKDIYEKDFRISDSDYQSRQYLYDEKIIAKAELRQEESKWLNKKIPLENIGAMLLENVAMDIIKKRELMDLDKQYRELHASFVQGINKLSVAIALWREQYVLVASVSGRLVFADELQVNMNITTAQEVFWVEADHSECYIKVLVDQDNFGKVAIGQPVVCRLPSYPFEEYGVLNGKVQYISRRPNKNEQYMIRVGLDNGLMTSSGVRLTFSNQLKVDADIVTKKDRLLLKFMHSVKGLFAGKKAMIKSKTKEEAQQ